MLAEANIKHPARVLISGKSGSGKTYLVTNIIDQVMRGQIDRLIVICPTWSSQQVFRTLDNLVDYERDVFEDLDKNTFETIYQQVKQQIRYCNENGLTPIRTALLIDDCGSDNLIHGGRISPFGKLAIQFRHLNISAFVLVQNPKLVSPNFRENANHFIFFPSNRVDDMNWIYKEYGSGAFSKHAFFKVLARVWEGDETGISNFFYVYCPERSSARFFSNFTLELTVRRKPLILKEFKYFFIF